MKIKRFFTLLLVCLLAFSLLTPVFAAEEQTTIDLGDGFYMVVTIEQAPMSRAGDVITGSKTGKVYSGTTQVGVLTVYGDFDISGSTAKAVRSAITGSGMNGWSYDRGTTSRSGNKVTGTGYFSSGSNSRSITLTLTCSPSGVIS